MSQDVAEQFAAQLEELLTFFGYNVAVAAEQDGRTVSLNIETQDGARLIGHHGDTLAAIQHVMNSMQKSIAGADHYYITVDVSGYKQARAERLADKVKKDAEEVIESGEPKRLRPMTAGERRIVHMTLAEISGVATESEGEGRERRVVIVPKPE